MQRQSKHEHTTAKIRKKVLAKEKKPQKVCKNHVNQTKMYISTSTLTNTYDLPNRLRRLLYSAFYYIAYTRYAERKTRRSALRPTYRR
jgi:hypothetical protein